MSPNYIKLRARVRVGVISLLALSGSTASSHQLSRNELDSIATTPTNDWQKQPRPSKAIPSTQAGRQIRALRDAYVDKVSGLGRPIEEFGRQLSYGWSDHSLLPSGNWGIKPAFPDETVILGTFTSFDEVLTQSHQAIYSEMHISVQKVIFPQDSSLTIGSHIDVLTAGGSITTPAGTVLSFKAKSRPFGLIPNGRYFLFLRHVKSGDFYLTGDSISITTGVAWPNSPDAVQAAQAGQWQFSSLNESQVSERLSELLLLQDAR